MSGDAYGPGAGRRLLRALASEWVKARSVASTWAALGTLCFVLPAIGAVICATQTDADVSAPGYQALAQVGAGLAMSQVALGVLGALLITGEYASGSVVPSLTAVPDRRLLLSAKALLGALLTAPFALAASSATALVCVPLLRSRGADLTLGDPTVVRAALGTTAVLVLTVLLGLAVGTLLRSSAAATVVLTVLLFLLPVLVALLPVGVRTGVGRWLPGQAGASVLVLGPDPEHLSPAIGLLVLAVEVALTGLVALVALVRRDAS